MERVRLWPKQLSLLRPSQRSALPQPQGLFAGQNAGGCQGNAFFFWRLFLGSLKKGHQRNTNYFLGPKRCFQINMAVVVKTSGIPFWLVGEFITHFRACFSRIGMFTGGTSFDPWPFFFFFLLLLFYIYIYIFIYILGIVLKVPQTCRSEPYICLRLPFIFWGGVKAAQRDGIHLCLGGSSILRQI